MFLISLTAVVNRSSLPCDSCATSLSTAATTRTVAHDMRRCLRKRQRRSVQTTFSKMKVLRGACCVSLLYDLQHYLTK